MGVKRTVTVWKHIEYKRDYVQKDGGDIMRATKMNIAWTGHLQHFNALYTPQAEPNSYISAPFAKAITCKQQSRLIHRRYNVYMYIYIYIYIP